MYTFKILTSSRYESWCQSAFCSVFWPAVLYFFFWVSRFSHHMASWYAARKKECKTCYSFILFDHFVIRSKNLSISNLISIMICSRHSIHCYQSVANILVLKNISLFLKFGLSEKQTKYEENLHHVLYIYLLNVQTMRKIFFSIFLCFSESPNFNDF